MEADLVLVNGRIYTLEEQQPLVEALAVRGGWIVAAGANSEIRELAGPDTDELDVGGRTVLPAFADGHIHLVGYGLSLHQVQLDGVPSLSEAVARVASRVQQAPPGEWVLGRGWNRNLWPGAPFPTRQDLDAVSPQNPVYLESKDGHAAWANSLALEAAHITVGTPDPAGAALERDASTGSPTGLLKEAGAMRLVGAVRPKPTLDQLETAVRGATTRLHEMGIVSVHVPEGPAELAAIQSLWRDGELELRVNMLIPDGCLASAAQMGLSEGLGDEWLRLGGIKIFADGSLGTRTADMFDPYEGEPENRGLEVTDSARLEALVGQAASVGWSVAIHAIGDRGNARALDALEEHWRAWTERGLRPRLEHVQLLTPQDLPRLGAMGVIASMQPIHCTSDMLMADRHWGSRCSGAYAWASLRASGAVLAFGSDAPVEDPSVLRGLYAAVTRQCEDGSPSGGWCPEQRLSLRDAVYAYTMGNAYASGEDAIKGSLSPGKLADMVVLSQDIFALPPEELLHTRVESTLLGGSLVYGGDAS